MYPATPLTQFNRLLSELFTTKVRVYADHLPQTVRDAGFIDVNVRLIHFKIGGWAKGIISGGYLIRPQVDLCGTSWCSCLVWDYWDFG
jgi:hypothetical protein